MPEHTVQFTIPNFEIGATGIEFRVRQDGTAFGKIRISKKGLVCIAANKKIGHEISWERLHPLAVKAGTPVEIKTLFRRRRKLRRKLEE
jgi:hypothetical protein